MAEHAHTPSHPSRRRTLLAAASAVVMGGGITAGVAASVADYVPSDPDAKMIALWPHYKATRDAVNSDPEIPDSDPRWDAYFAACDQIDDWKPATIEGLIAKARMTKEEATTTDGGEELESMSMTWAWDVLNGLIQLGGRA